MLTPQQTQTLSARINDLPVLIQEARQQVELAPEEDRFAAMGVVLDLEKQRDLCVRALTGNAGALGQLQQGYAYP